MRNGGREFETLPPFDLEFKEFQPPAAPPKAEWKTPGAIPDI